MACRYKSNIIDIDDLMQQGNLGLIEAIDKFDVRYDTRLSPYSTFYIRKYVLKYISDMSRTIRIPKYLHYRRRRVCETKDRLSYQLGRDPTDLEISDELNISPTQVRRAMSVPTVVSIETVNRRQRVH